MDTSESVGKFEVGEKVYGDNISDLRYACDTVLVASSVEEQQLLSVLLKNAQYLV